MMYTKMHTIQKLIKERFIWPVALLALLCANLAYATQSSWGSAVTLGVFLLLPGYLAFKAIRHKNTSQIETLAFSLGLSLLFLMLAGLLLNVAHYVGFGRPLQPGPILAMLDFGVIVLTVLNRGTRYVLPRFSLTRFQWWLAGGLLLLPLFAVFGAIRLNNGASNVLTMVLFAVVAAVFLLLLWKKDLKPLYPYALFCIALAILFTVSLRGWTVTGHDIQREFYVFQLTASQGFWDIGSLKDTYNACLSITILPTIFKHITSIPDPYIYKVVFQIIFALGVVPIYLFMRRLCGSQLALMGAFLFISFPTFLNDMPMLNRQEISFIFFSLLMLLSFSGMPRRQKKILTVLFLLGSVISHYSSSYIVLGILVVGWLLYMFLARLHKTNGKARLSLTFPTLNVTIILVAILLAFLWNAQITGTTDGLEKTTSKTIAGLFNSSGQQSSDVSYSLLGGKEQDPEKLLQAYVKEVADTPARVSYEPEQDMPLTALGRQLDKLLSVASMNSLIRNLSAKFLQVMLIIGCLVLFWEYKKSRTVDPQSTYFLALIVTSIGFLVLQTILPQLSVDYGTLRLFQQELIILALPTILGLLAVLRYAKKLAMPLASGVLAVLFLHLSGFIPQLTGGYAPQLSLNNAGSYYDAYYIHEAELQAARWLQKNRNPTVTVAMDQYALSRFHFEHKDKVVTTSPFVDFKRAYIYRDYLNKAKDVYVVNINSNLYHYSVDRGQGQENRLYSNDRSEVMRVGSD